MIPTMRGGFLWLVHNAGTDRDGEPMHRLTIEFTATAPHQSFVTNWLELLEEAFGGTVRVTNRRPYYSHPSQREYCEGWRIKIETLPMTGRPVDTLRDILTYDTTTEVLT